MRWCAFALVLLAPAASTAQPKARPAPQSFTLTKQTHAGAEDVAHARFAAGDCPAALDAFDVAVEHSADPTLRRDRGICHEKLGHPYPAIDDYRAYVAAVPTAPDADDIRARLVRLQGYTTKDEPEPDQPKAAAQTKTITEVERDRDRRDEADSSSLRTGKGFVFGGFVNLRAVGKNYFYNGQRAGLRVAWSFDAHNAIMIELGWLWLDADKASGGDGPSTYLGYELRVAFDPYGTHSFIFGAGLGYERWRYNALNTAVNALAPRARLGYRLVLGRAFGLEITGDGGPVIGWSEAGGDAQTLISVGGVVAFVVGF